MSKHVVSPLHVEWTPTWVRATNVQTGETAGAASLSELGGIVRGHQLALVGVGHNHVFLKALRLPKAAPDDLRNVISIQLGQLFPLMPDQLSFDFVQTTDQTVDGYLTIVAAMRSELLRDLRAELKEVGLSPMRILPLSLASAVVASRAGLQDALVVEQGPQGLVLDVVQGGIIRFSRSATAGSDASVEVRRTLSAAKSGNLPILTVGAMEMSHAKASTESALALLHEAPQFDFELMEERLQATKKRAANRMRLAAAFALFAVVVVVTIFIQRAQATAIVARSQGAWARTLTTLTAVESTDSSNAARLVGIQQMLKRAFDPAQPISDIGSVIDDSLPPGAWLTGISVERGKSIDIRGAASAPADLTKFVTALGASPRLREVTMVFANSSMIGETPVVQFDVSAVAIGNLPMPTPPKHTSGQTASATTTTANQESGM